MEQPPLPPENSESAPTTNKMAIRSMVLGIVGPIVASGGALACSEHQADVPGTLMLVAGIGVMALVLAIIFGGTARRQIREAKGRERGKGMALAESILGYVLLIPTAFFVVLVIAVSTI